MPGTGPLEEIPVSHYNGAMGGRKMKKQAQNRGSSLPPDLAEVAWSGLPIIHRRMWTSHENKVPDKAVDAHNNWVTWQDVSPLPKKERNEDEFNKNLDAWLENMEEVKEWLVHWDHPWFGVWAIEPNGKVRRRRADLRDGTLHFESVEKEWEGRPDLEFAAPYAPEDAKQLLKWREELAEKTCDILKKLYFRHGVLPAPILSALEDLAVADWLFDEEGWKKLRSSKGREKDAQILEEAAKIIEPYGPFLPDCPSDCSYPDGDGLRWAAEKIRELFPSQRHRPKELKLVVFARELGWYFWRLTKNPLYKYVGELLSALFPRWSSVWDIRETTKKLVKAGRGVEEELYYMRELLVGDFHHTARMAEDYWSKKGKHTSSKEVTRRPRKARGT